MIGIGFAITGFLLWLKPSVWLVIGAVLLFGVVYSAHKRDIMPLVNSFQGAAFIFFLWVTYKLLGSKGIIGLIVVCLLIVGWILYKKRKLFINTIREIEKMIWGKTNDRKK